MNSEWVGTWCGARVCIGCNVFLCGCQVDGCSGLLHAGGKGCLSYSSHYLTIYLSLSHSLLFEKYQYFYIAWERGLLYAVLQTKDKSCDIINTTQLYPFTTTLVAKTTGQSRSRGETTTARASSSTSHPPTSVPTEGKTTNICPKADNSNQCLEYWSGHMVRKNSILLR